MTDALHAYNSDVTPPPRPQAMPPQRGHGVMAVARTAADVASTAHTLWQIGKAAMPLARGAIALL